jgi:hypothetical protein
MSTRFKTGVVLGLAGGYVLGTKAGRQRYEQIRRMWARLTSSPMVKQAAERTKDLAEGQTKRALYAVQARVEKAGTAVKHRLGNGGDPTDDMRETLASNRSSGTTEDSTPATAREAMLP